MQNKIWLTDEVSFEIWFGKNWKFFNITYLLRGLFLKGIAVYLPWFWEETSKWDLPVLDLFPASGALLGPWRLLGLSFDWHCHDAEKEKKKAHITIFFSPSNVPTDWEPSNVHIYRLDGRLKNIEFNVVCILYLFIYLHQNQCFLGH